MTMAEACERLQQELTLLYLEILSELLRPIEHWLGLPK